MKEQISLDFCEQLLAPFLLGILGRQAVCVRRKRQFGFPAAAARADLPTRVPAVLRKPTTTILTIGTKSGGSSALEKWHSQGISSRSRPNQQVERLVLRTYSCVPRVGIQGATNVVFCTRRNPTEARRHPYESGLHLVRRGGRLSY